MAYRFLSNLIKSPAVHQKGEIVDLDTATAADLKRRGIVEEVEAAATHLFGQNNEGMSLGGKPINEDIAATAPATPTPTQDEDEVPQVTTTHADPVGAAADQRMPSLAQQQVTTPAQAPAQPHQPAQAPATGQPSPEDIAATAASAQ